jgi:hypothetical protein
MVSMLICKSLSRYRIVKLSRVLFLEPERFVFMCFGLRLTNCGREQRATKSHHWPRDRFARYSRSRRDPNSQMISKCSNFVAPVSNLRDCENRRFCTCIFSDMLAFCLPVVSLPLKACESSYEADAQSPPHFASVERLLVLPTVLV